MHVRPIRTGLACLALLSSIRPAFAGAFAPEERFPLRPVRYELDLRVDFEEETISGTARLTLRNPSSSPATQVSLLLYRLLTVRGVKDGAGGPIPFTQRVVAFEDEPRRHVNHVVVPLPTPIPPSGDVVLQVEYGGYLAGYVETGSLYVKDRVDESFTILRDDAEAYPTVRVPSTRVNRAAGLADYDYLARITVPKSHVVANGGLLVERTERDGRATYVYRNIKPAWRMDFAIARYGLLERDGFRIFHLPADAGSAERILGSARSVRASYTKRFGPLSYSVGMLMFHVLYQVAGPERFDRIVGGFFRDYRERGGSTGDFVRYARLVAGESVEPVFRDWLYTTRWLEILSSGTEIEDLPSRYRPPG